MKIFEAVEDYNYSIERALAGALYNKKNDELSSTEVKAAQDLSAKVTDLDDYFSLYRALEDEDYNNANKILSKYNLDISVTESDQEYQDMTTRNIRETELDNIGENPYDGVGDYDDVMATEEPFDDELDFDADMGVDAPESDEYFDNSSLPDIDAAPVVAEDPSAKINNLLSEIVAIVPELQVKDFKQVVDRMEETLTSVKTMGNQFLKESGENTLKQCALKSSKFKRAFFESVLGQELDDFEISEDMLEKYQITDSRLEEVERKIELFNKIYKTQLTAHDAFAYVTEFESADDEIYGYEWEDAIAKYAKAKFGTDGKTVLDLLGEEYWVESPKAMSEVIAYMLGEVGSRFVKEDGLTEFGIKTANALSEYFAETED